MRRGPVEFHEGRQRFAFGDQWIVAKYDDEACSKALQKAVEGSRAVDFCGQASDEEVVFFIEVKDFRAYHTQNRDRIDASTGDLAREVAQKVRDSIAGIVGAGRTFDRDWTRIGKACASPKVQLVVVLWMEIDSHGLTSQAIKPRLDVHRKKLKEHLRWLNARVMLLNERVWANDIPGLQVSTIARP